MSHPADYYLKGEISNSEIYNENGIMSVKAYACQYTGGNYIHSKNIGFTLDINTGKLLTLPEVLHMEDDIEGVKQVILDAVDRYVADTCISNLDQEIHGFRKINPVDYDFYIREDGMICYSMDITEFGRPYTRDREELPLHIWIDDIESEEESEEETENVTKEEPAEKVTPQVTATPEEHTYCKNIYETYGEYAFVRKKEQPVDCGDYYEVQVEILESGEAQPNTGEIDNPVVMDTPYLRFSKDCTVCWITDPAGTEYASVVSLDEYAEKRGGIRDFTSVGSMRMIGYPYPITYDKNGYIKTFVDGFIQ
jgi:hypothetical protein